MTPTVRDANRADRPALRRLQRALPDPNPALLDYAVGGGSGSAGPPVLLVAGRPPIGYALSLLGPTAVVAELAVAAGRRREGVGTALLEATLDRARAAGCDDVTLRVRRDDGRARAFYGSLGFEAVGTEPGYYRDGADALVMTRPP